MIKKEKIRQNFQYLQNNVYTTIFKTGTSKNTTAVKNILILNK